MEKKKPDNDSLSVENLIRLKRYETPSKTFWANFDSELHDRMLKTLVNKEPWYTSFYSGFSRTIVNMGLCASAAVLAFAFTLPLGIQRSPRNITGLDQSQIQARQNRNFELSSSTDAYEIEMAKLDHLDEHLLVSIDSQKVAVTDYSHDLIGSDVYDVAAFPIDSLIYAPLATSSKLVF